MLQPSDFILVRSEYSQTGVPRFNGGYIGSVACRTGVKNNVFDDVTDNDRLYGATVYRKVFWKVLGTLSHAMVYVTSPSTGDDSIVMFKGTVSDLERDITGQERKYGAAYLANNVNSGQNVLNVAYENVNESIFANGDTVYITDGHKEEIHENISIASLSNGARVLLSQNTGLINNYKAMSTYVCSVLKIAQINYSYSQSVLDSSSGSWNGQLILDPNGIVDEKWTIRFQSPVQFICTGARIGTVGYGTINTTFAPLHSVDAGPPGYINAQVPYFTLPANSLQGSWQIGETFVFQTNSPTVPIWFKRVVKPGCLSSSSIFTHRITGFDPSTL